MQPNATRFWALVDRCGCAASVAPPAPLCSLAAEAEPAEIGMIVAIDWAPAEDWPGVRMPFREPATAGGIEYRAQDGATIAVVQFTTTIEPKL
jgi:hypothetical protein